MTPKKVALFESLLMTDEILTSDTKIALKKSALYVTESFIIVMPRLFEPYVTPLMTHLLATLNDANTRETSLYCSQVLMRSLSQAALTLTVPSLVGILNDHRAAWRAKKAAVQMISQLSQIKRAAVLGKISRSLLPRLVQVVLEEPVAELKNEAKSALATFANGELEASVYRV